MKSRTLEQNSLQKSIQDHLSVDIDIQKQGFHQYNKNLEKYVASTNKLKHVNANTASVITESCCQLHFQKLREIFVLTKRAFWSKETFNQIYCYSVISLSSFTILLIQQSV